MKSDSLLSLFSKTMKRSHVVMIRPAVFGFNPQTAKDNVFQSVKEDPYVEKKAEVEFDTMVEGLRKLGVNVHVLQDIPEPSTPDSIFPNNWFTTHEKDAFVVYSMFAPNRREEVEKFQKQVERLSQEKSSKKRVIDYSQESQRGVFLEGTGSLVLDRENKIAYCCLSQRSHEELVERFSKDLGYEIITFHAFDQGKPVYHTNVLMGLGEEIVIICMEAVEKDHRDRLRESFERTGKEIIEITVEQMRHYAGNVLELQGDEKFIVMSEQAFASLTGEQKEKIMEYAGVAVFPLETIEYYGGGSARCMMAELF